jgi:uncharacterized membrane protein HdeD (DUF308 family)
MNHPAPLARKGLAMSTEFNPAEGLRTPFAGAIANELGHLRSHWVWFLLMGLLLVITGTLAIVAPPATVGTTFAATIFLGVLLMVAGVSTIISSFWIGRWSGFLVQLLVGILYMACGFLITENPVVTAVTLTVFIAVSFIVLGVFRTVGSLVLRFPQWGWSLLNGVVTLLAGIVIYRQLPFDALWVIGLLIGLEMLFNGWTWIMLGLALKRLPQAS